MIKLIIDWRRYFLIATLTLMFGQISLTATAQPNSDSEEPYFDMELFKFNAAAYTIETKEPGTEAHNSAINRMKEYAESGHAKSLLYMANLYAEGRYVRQNRSEAVEYFNRAAETDDPSVLYSIGAHFYYGTLFEKDLSKAAIYFQDAAALGHRGAQYTLARMYQLGQGVPKNEKRAFELMREAVQQVNAFLFMRLSEYYEFGIGTEQSSVDSYKWALLAAAVADTEDEELTSGIASFVALMESRLTPEQIDLGQELASKCYASYPADCG